MADTYTLRGGAPLARQDDAGDALATASGIQVRAAKLLGISERSPWYRVKNLKIPVRGVEKRLEESSDRSGIPIPERVVYVQERTPR